MGKEPVPIFVGDCQKQFSKRKHLSMRETTRRFTQIHPGFKTWDTPPSQMLKAVWLWGLLDLSEHPAKTTKGILTRSKALRRSREPEASPRDTD